MKFPSFGKPPEFGKTTDRYDHADGPSDVIERHYHKGQEVLAVHSQEESIMVEDKDSATAVMQGGLDILVPGKISKVTFEVYAHPETGELLRVTRRYELGRARR